MGDFIPLSPSRRLAPRPCWGLSTRPAALRSLWTKIANFLKCALSCIAFGYNNTSIFSAIYVVKYTA